MIDALNLFGALVLVGSSVLIAAAGAVLWRESLTTPAERHSHDGVRSCGQTTTVRCKCGQEFTAEQAHWAERAWAKHHAQEVR